MKNWLFKLRCPECGEKIDENERYCSNCGADLDAPIDLIVDVKKSREYFEKAQEYYDKASNLKDALSYCDLAIQCAVNFSEAHNLRGLILDAMHQPIEAIVSYKEAVRLDPTFEDAIANLKDAELEQLEKSRRQNRTWTNIIFGAVVVSLFFLCAFSVLYLYVFGRPYFGPKTTVVFEPDFSKVSVVDPLALEKTAKLLNERSVYIGYSQVSFDVSEFNQIIAYIPSYLDVEDLVTRIEPIGLVEFVDFGEIPMAINTRVNTDFGFEYFQQVDGQVWNTIMTNDEILSVAVAENLVGVYDVQFMLTDDGAKTFFDYTSQNVGSYLGIVVDKVVISAPRVNAPIEGGSAMISGNFTQKDAENLAAYLRISPLPIPIVLVEISDGK